MIVLGFSVGHDKGAALIKDGKLMVAISQERLSRIKRDGAYTGTIPVESMKYCIQYAKCSYNDIDLFVYSSTELVDDVDDRMGKIFGRSIIQKLKFIPHHLAHAYSTFYSSGFDAAAVVVADASGSIFGQTKLKEWYNEPDNKGFSEGQHWAEAMSIYHFNKKGYNEVYKKWIKIPVYDSEYTSLGMLYSGGSLQLIYNPEKNTWPAGKLMGLASYAEADFVDSYPDVITEDNNDILIPNRLISPNVTYNSDFFSKANVAGVYQREQVRASLMLAKKAKVLTDSNKICVAGGSFLNCNSNTEILNSGLFEECYFLAPSDDSGIPLGCAWYGASTNHDGAIETSPLLPYLGKHYSESDIMDAINTTANISFERIENFTYLLEKVSDILEKQNVIGWFQGGSELGPRALGNRSILASPEKKWMTNHINNDIKKREWYRPFAPAVLFEYQSDIFNLSDFSPNMLLTTTVKEEWLEKIPAVVHIDNTSRVQSVTEETNYKFYHLISSFYKRTGIPVLLNTSFNGPEEPIVETPKNAIDSFLKNNLNYLVIDNFIIKRAIV